MKKTTARLLQDEKSWKKVLLEKAIIGSHSGS
jgi:hypothetical protein